MNKKLRTHREVYEEKNSNEMKLRFQTFILLHISQGYVSK